jgi:hypothetical protein
MFVEMNFEGPDEMVTCDEIRRLAPRVQAAWTAWCVGTLRPLLPPSFHERVPFDQGVEAAWNFALGEPVDEAELKALGGHVEAMATIFGQGETAPGNPGGWMVPEQYHLSYLRCLWGLFDIPFDPGQSPYLAEEAVEAAGWVYKTHQCWRQGFWGVVEAGYPYALSLPNRYYAMTRRAFEVATAHTGEPTRGMFDGIGFPWDCDRLAPDLAEASRASRPLPIIHERWLRATGRWLGPA